MPADAHPLATHALPAAARALLGDIVDYAGLFPPAGLEMQVAVENYAAYRAGPDAWALGRFIVPAARLGEMADAAAGLAGGVGEAWRIGALLSADVRGDVARIEAFARRPAAGGPPLVVDVVELKAAGAGEARSALREAPPPLTAYVEIPPGADARGMVDALREAGGRAKVRTGGVRAEAFPGAEALLGFLRACTDADLPFKATAGLHHPVRGRYRLTYEPGAADAEMYGYLNLLFATALLRRGEEERTALSALAETDAGAFRLGADGAAWREHHLGREEIAALRERGMVSFGSCSFREPLDELGEAFPA